MSDGFANGPYKSNKLPVLKEVIDHLFIRYLNHNSIDRLHADILEEMSALQEMYIDKLKQLENK